MEDRGMEKLRTMMGDLGESETFTTLIRTHYDLGFRDGILLMNRVRQDAQKACHSKEEFCTRMDKEIQMVMEKLSARRADYLFQQNGLD